MENFIIYLENSTIGTKLSLEKNTKLNKGYLRWAVEDEFNGLSVPTEIYSSEINGRISDYIYGFYNVGDVVTLKLYGKNGILANTINNVIIVDKKGAN